MAMAWSRISSKVITYPFEADAACRRRCGHWQGHSGVCIPHIVDKRKGEILGAHDAAMTPLAQMRGGLCHGCLGRQQSPKPPTECRSAPCPPRANPSLGIRLCGTRRGSHKKG